jgi:hypothetical protein
MKAHSIDENAVFEIRLVGNTGYANRSKLVIKKINLGSICLDSEAWDITQLVAQGNEGSLFQKLVLTIPSGEFELMIAGIEPIEPEDNSDNYPGVRFKGRGWWSGITAGLLGGMSGYGNFWIPDAEVTQGLFHPSGNTWRSLIEYQALKARSRLLSQGTPAEVLAKEAAIAALSEQPEDWKQWLNYLTTAPAIERERSILEAEALALAEENAAFSLRRKQVAADPDPDYGDDMPI